MQITTWLGLKNRRSSFGTQKFKVHQSRKPMTSQHNLKYSFNAVSKTYLLRLKSRVISTYLCIDGIAKKCVISIFPFHA